MRRVASSASTILRRALVLRGDRADLHLHDAAVLVALDLLQLRPGHARCDSLDVEEDPPRLLDGDVDTELVGDLHLGQPRGRRSARVTWRSSIVSTSAADPVPVQSTSSHLVLVHQRSCTDVARSARASSQSSRPRSTGLPRTPA